MSFKKENHIKIIKRALEQPKPIGDNNMLQIITTPTDMLQSGGRMLWNSICLNVAHKWHKEKHVF
jgi:hypothetical protein